jgi:hypothetical protein
MSENRTELSQLGEFGLIERIKSKFQNQNSTTIKGIGDDAAILAASEKTYWFQPICFWKAFTLIYRTCRCNI